MEEVIFLFRYHKLDEVTLRHYRMLEKFHPAHQIVPLGYELKIPDWLPGTVDVALDWDYGWPIYDSWLDGDKVYLRWFLGPHRPQARRYIFFEYDIQVKAPAKEFYGSTWDADAAAVGVRTPQSDPAWVWWAHAPRLGDAFVYRQGMTPLAGTLWTHEAMSRISQSRQLLKCYCELRMGTLAKRLGLQCAAIPGAAPSFSWRAEDIRVTNQATWIHPVKH